MTEIQISLLRPAADGTTEGVAGYLEAVPTRARDVGDDMILPKPFRVRLGYLDAVTEEWVDDGSATVTLAPTTEGVWAWKFYGKGLPTWWKYVPDVESVAFTALVDVDPASLDPAAEPEAAWYTVLDATVEAAVEAYLIENPPASAVTSVDGKTGDVTLSSTYAPRNATTAITLTDASQAIDMPASPVAGDVRTLVITADGGTPSWDSLITWDAGIAPTLSTVEGERDVLTFLYTGDDWLGFVSGLFAAAPDVTAPTAGTLSVTAQTHTTIDVSVAGAADETALAPAPYAYSSDNGATYSAYQAGATYQFAGLTASTSYTLRHKVKDAAGNEAAGVAVAHSTDAAPADSTAPTAGTLAGSAETSSGFTLTVTGAADETELHAEPYAFSTDNGSTYSVWQAAATYDATGLDASTEYTCVHKVRDAALNVSTGTPITVTTSSGVTTLASDTFNRADGALGTSDGPGSLVWTGGSPAMTISGNAAISNGPNSTAQLNVSQTDMHVEADVTSAGAGGVILRGDGTVNNYYRVIQASSTWYIVRIVAGSASIIKTVPDTAAQTSSLGATATTGASSVDFTVYRDGVSLFTHSDTHASRLAGTWAGIYSGGAVIDNFLCESA